MLIGAVIYGATVPGRTIPAICVAIAVGAITVCALGFALVTAIKSADSAQPVIQLVTCRCCSSRACSSPRT